MKSPVVFYRYLFIPADHRLPCIAGWRGPNGFIPDEPLRDREGFLIRFGTQEKRQ